MPARPCPRGRGARSGKPSAAGRYPGRAPRWRRKTLAVPRCAARPTDPAPGCRAECRPAPASRPRWKCSSCSAAGAVGLPGSDGRGLVGVARVPVPQQLAGIDVIGADDPGRLAGAHVVVHRTADDHPVARDHRRRGRVVETLFTWGMLAHRSTSAVVAEAGAYLAGSGIQRDQPGVGSGHEQPLATALRLAGGGAA